MNDKLTIIGSGLTGPLLSTILAQKYNLKIQMFERSEDSRKLNSFSGRSINLALSKRGINALQYAGIYDKDFELSLIPMHGRSIHSLNGEVNFQPYSNKNEHHINSVSRLKINQILMKHAEKSGCVNINFNMKCQRIDLINKKIYFDNNVMDIDSTIIGTDGYKSVVAENISEINNQKLEYINIDHSYKELEIPAKNNEYQIDPNSLHIWPRRDMMMIALPNLDKSFTCTLFMKSNGVNSFETIDTKEKVKMFFEENFNDVLDIIPDLQDDYLNNPTGKLIGLKVPTWSYLNKALIIGDAAHATVPFYGQGMNASFEDCYVLAELIKDNKSNWNEIFEEFQLRRKNDADAILDLSLDNYKVMRNDVLDETHIKKQKLSFLLNNDFPDYFIPLYTMVSFTTIPYSIAYKRGKIQDNILNKLLKPDLNHLEKYDKQTAEKLIFKYLSKIKYD